MPDARSRRGHRLILASAGMMILCSQATAQPVGGAERSPFFGEWELDLTRMPETYGLPPKRVVFKFQDAGAGMWRTDVDITARDESVRHTAIQYRRDGRMARGEGDTAEGDSAAFEAPASNVLVMSQAKDKHLIGVRVYTISTDGREMTEAAANVDAQGTPFVRKFHFKRIR